jgi:hypothetical protein
MITYLMLGLAAIYFLRKWILFRKYNKNQPSYEQIDSDLIVELNAKSHSNGGS